MFALYDADEDGFLSKQEVIQYAQGKVCSSFAECICRKQKWHEPMHILIFSRTWMNTGEFEFTPPESCMAAWQGQSVAITHCIWMVESWHWPKIVADPASKDRLWRNLVTPGSILRWWNCMDWQFSGSIIFANFWHLHGFQCFRTVLKKISICIYWVIWVCSLRQSRHRLWLLPADEGDHWRRPCHREGAESFASPIWEILRSSHLRSRREEKLKAPRLSMLLKSLDSRLHL